ncbi:MAG: AMP-binding protein, partial [candidate division Zixibacteria bacterium]|nr:AMP-binding protein [candidate division Zixibacteria bacterium]
MTPWLARNVIYLPALTFRGVHVKTIINEVRAFHGLDSDGIKEYQWQKLKNLLHHVYEQNPYYRALFEQKSLHPEDITSAETFRQIPFLTKRIIQTCNDDLLSRDHLRTSPRRTSGSTGMPIRFVKDRRATAYMNALMHEVYNWHGIEIGDRQARIWGRPLDFRRRLTAQLKDFVLNRRKLVSFDISEKTCRHFFYELKHFQPKYLYGLPCSIVEFTQTLQKINLEPTEMGLEIILCTGETLSPEKKKFLQDAYQCPVLNEYGATECGIIAFPCRHDQLHLMSHNLYIEIINPETGHPAKPGETGEIVLTELNGYAMPFIRYRLGDIALVDNSRCSCGLELPLIAEIQGRTGEIILTLENKKVAMAILDRVLEKYVLRFRVYQRALDRLEVIIENYPGFCRQHTEEIKALWRPYLGEEMKVDFKIVEHILPDRSGKLTSFISDIRPVPVESK